ncbi:MULTISPECIES: fumarylacetoacetate hydrolase family protein [unclassified Variovorax]|uniref:fumarylacetoacetate hydrolase family protein n=1 Tax=unclassified Variovorax TaxID=663243 RepID=UPI0025790673|nr:MULTISPECIES: fumarylacetoacetate hydrolase family protein [unclassified Variovorax]MDM0090524.1 fumarylacetoacetate hydrolase family protein [Variovorax sp. J22G40]MDM0147811.1 fumarylacetoacetate hydrolase family protein [Variovorax sp. J2P1-31]
MSVDTKNPPAPTPEGLQVQPVSIAIVGSEQRFPVRRVYCVGRNYLAHIREMKEGDERDPPFFFQKPADSVVTDGRVPYPVLTDDFQFEFELVVAIGSEAQDVSPEASLAHVFGYAAGLDMTRRDRQRECNKRGLPWEQGKSFDHSAPCGPIHPVAQVGHIRSGALSLAVNGAARQDSVLEKMIWNVHEIVSELSRQYRLFPGDLIYTGTPEGVGPVQRGDRLVGRIEGLAPLQVEIV